MKKMMSVKGWLALAAMMAVLCVCALAAAEELPAYVYSGNDPVEKAVVQWMTDSGLGDGYYREEGSVMIPAPVILKTVEQDNGQIKVYGNFWVFVYTKREGTLVCVSGGEAPGVMTLEKQGEDLRAVAVETAGDGDDYGKDIVRFCEGDKELEEAFFSAHGDVVDEVRIRFARDYVERNGLAIAAIKDPFWDPMPLYNEERKIEGSLQDDGSWLIRVSVRPGEAGTWEASDDLSEGAAARLKRSGMTDGAFEALYTPAADGAITVVLRHYTGIACDGAHTFDLKVSGGKIQEVTGGSVVYTTPDDEWEKLLVGLPGSQWLEKDTQFTSLSIRRNEDAGFDVEITSPLTHEAYVFRTTVYYDCDLDAFVYTEGERTELTAQGEAGETAQTVSGGRLELDAVDESALTLTWHRLGEPEIVFVRAE